MGRFFGRRPDRTQKIAGAIRGHLEEGERVVAAVDVQTPGTLGAAFEGAASGAVSGAADVPISFVGESEDRNAWLAESVPIVGADAARRLVYASLALTTSRLLVLSRGKVTRRIGDLVAEWPVDEIEWIRYSGNSHEMVIHLHGRTLTFEVELAPKFLPPVYRELPRHLEQVKSQGRSS